MTAEYNAVNARAELLGDGSGWQRMRGQFPTAPAGAKQAIYVMRIETPDLGTFEDTGLTWNAAGYYGLKFDSIFPSTSERDHADYDNFFGVALADSTPFDHSYWAASASIDSMYPGRFGTTDPDLYLYDGNGAFLDLSADAVTVDDYAFMGGADVNQPNVRTLVWRVYSHPTTNEVLYECWASDGSEKLTGFDIANDLDPDDPKATFPVAGSGTYIKSGSIHGDIFGTNWRPNDGVMAFPLYFMAGHGSTAFRLHIPYVGVQYSLSVT